MSFPDNKWYRPCQNCNFNRLFFTSWSQYNSPGNLRQLFCKKQSLLSRSEGKIPVLWEPVQLKVWLCRRLWCWWALFLSERLPRHPCRQWEVCRCGSGCGEASSALSSRCAGRVDTSLCEFCQEKNCQCVNIAVTGPDVVRHSGPWLIDVLNTEHLPWYREYPCRHNNIHG